MTSLPIRFWNAGIMAVSVGPGLMQLIRMPCLPSSGYHQPTHASMMYFESASPLHDHFSSCSRNHSTAASKPLVANNSEITGMWPCQPIAAEDEITLIAEPSDIFGTSSSARCRAPTKFTRMVSHSLNGGPGSPAQLKSPSMGPSIEAATCSMFARSRRSMSRARATGTVVGLMSRAVTVAPRSTRIFAVAWPMPDAAPVTTTDFPSYPKTSSTMSSLHSAVGQDEHPCLGADQREPYFADMNMATLVGWQFRELLTRRRIGPATGSRRRTADVDGATQVRPGKLWR